MRRASAACVGLWLVGAAGAACRDHRARDTSEPAAHAACNRSGTNITFRQLAITDSAAILVTAPIGDTRRFVVEQEGRIRILADGHYQPASQAFLDISADNHGPVLCCGEQGLLGLAFDPDYATSRAFYISYTAANPAGAGDPANPYVDVIARYTAMAADPSHADPATGTIVLSIPDFARNHNGGMLEFGSDGFLYMGTGDGGNANDPARNGQNPHALLGKLLRLDVDHPRDGRAYAIPPGNPFAGGGGAPEVYIVGARNPWRWTFDRANGDMWIADVGQDTIEELDYLPAGHQAGVNLGWSMYEGNDCFHAPCSPAGMTPPVFTKTHAAGWCSIIGGQVYRGSCFPDLVGTYFFTDYCAHPLVEARVQADGAVSVAEVASSSVQTIDLDGATAPGVPPSPSGIHADAAGELYLTTVSCCGTAQHGGVYHLEASP